MKSLILLFLLTTFLFSKNDYSQNIIACDDNNATACVELGLAYSVGFTTDKKMDIQKSIHYYKKACDMDNVNGCRTLGTLFEYGLEIDKDINKARAYYAKACIIGKDSVSCKFYKELNKK